MRTISNLGSRLVAGTALFSALALGGCQTLLDVEFPGRIPTEQIADPSLAPVLVRSVVGDFECAYSNYTGGSSVHSDEYETANSNVPLANWGERTITPDENDYAIGGCDGNFGMNLTLHTARFQADEVYKKLDGWTDAQVAGRTLLKATARAYGAYATLMMGEGFCQVAFDGGDPGPPAAALARAETQFQEAITLAAGNADILDLARVGLARTKMDLKKWADAAQVAGQVTAGYNKNADRGQETARRWNKLFRLANQVAAYTVAPAYRTMNDPRVLVADAGRGAFNSEVRLWINTKYTSLTTPIRLASYKEAQLILAEAQARQGQVAAAQGTVNAYRALYKTATSDPLPALTFADQADAITKIIEERRRELSFEGGHRLNDLLRTNTPWKVGSNQFTNRLYGTTTCWPHPTREINGV